MTDSAKRTTRELAGNAGLALVLLVFFLGLFVVRGFRFPVGPDGPVYLWWTRLAAVDGLAAVERPGVPGVTLALAGTLHLPVVAIVAALQCGLGVSVGLSAATLLREMASRDRATSLLGGALTGLFAVHLVSGYLANLALAATFLAGACALALGTRRGAVAASILIGAGGLSHPQFFLVAIAILALTAGLARLRNQPEARSEARRVVGASLGAAALAGVGFLVLLVGPAAPQVDTSRDGFLRRVGLLGTLAHLYRQRFLQHSARYVEWISLPLAIAGFGRVRGFVGRFLASWGIVTAVGVAFGLATALLPPDRFLAFGYVVPLLAAVGAMRLWRAPARPSSSLSTPAPRRSRSSRRRPATPSAPLFPPTGSATCW